MEILSTVTIEAAPGFLVKIGATELGYFRQTAQLEGACRLMNEKGEVLLVLADEGGIAGVFADTTSKPRPAMVLKATPSLLARIGEADAK